MTIYAKDESPYCWLTMQLLKCKDYALKMSVCAQSALAGRRHEGR
jgi:hypothetical protein